MLAKDLISKKKFALKLSDTGEIALDLMNELKVSHLPIVNDKTFVGLISEKNILELDSIQEPFKNLGLSLFTPFVCNHQHFFDAIEVVTCLHLSLIPVLNEREEYLGCVLPSELLEKAAALLNTNGPGGVIILQVHDHDYVLSEIARIIENENAKVLSFTTNLRSNGFLLITMKINTENFSSILKSLERFNYEIYSYFMNANDETDTFQKRLNEFMHYINI